MSVERKFKMALDETRMLMLGSQILFGFEFNAVFQQSFDKLPRLSQWLDGMALLLMSPAIAFLIAPGTQHRLVNDGQITARLQRAATGFSAAALLPFALALGLDIYVALQKTFGTVVAAATGACLTGAAFVLWYGVEFVYRAVTRKGRHMGQKEGDKPTPLQVRIDQLLTEARIAIPGAQALLGFQLLVALNDVFSKLPSSSQVVHAVALGCIAIALLLLVAPAAFHRLAFGGDDTEDVFRVGSALVTTALFPLAAGISGDIYVALTRVAGSPTVGLASAVACFLVFMGFWYVQPLILRRSEGSELRGSNASRL